VFFAALRCLPGGILLIINDLKISTKKCQEFFGEVVRSGIFEYQITNKAKNTHTMTTQKLREKLNRIEKIGYGTYRITIEHRRKVKDLSYPWGWYYESQYTTHITHNVAAVDRLSDHGYIPDRAISQFYTYRQALLALVRNR
jgi:hypothetical protein